MFLGFGIEIWAVGGRGVCDRFFGNSKFLCLTNMNILSSSLVYEDK